MKPTLERSMAGGNALVKLSAWTLALAVIALPVVGALNGWFAAERWPFRQLRIDARFERVNAEQVRAAAAPLVGGGFFAVDLTEVRRSVEQLPWIERAEVRRRWPDVLEIRVVERVVAAAWSDGRLVDAAGRLFSVPGDTMPQGLPLLSGPEARAPEMLSFQRAIAEAMHDTGMAATELSLSARGSWTLRTATGAEIVLGRDQAAERLRRFLDALRRAEASSGLVLVRADLRYANGFAVQWRQDAPTTNESVPQNPSIPSMPPQA